MAEAVYPARLKNGKGRGRKAEIDIVELRAAYEAGASMSACAARYGISHVTIRNHLLRAGVVSRKRASRLNLDDDVLRMDYERGLTVVQCGKKHGVCKKLIIERLRALGIAVRKKGPPVGTAKRHIDSEQLRSLYLSGLSVVDCGKLLGVNGATIHRRLLRMGIETRGVGRQPRADSPFLNGVLLGDKRAYRQALRKRYRPQIRAYERRRLRTNVRVALAARMGKVIRAALVGGKGGRSWQNMVSYTVEELRAHLQSTLPRGFTWDDFLSGALHIDHKIPQSKFNFLTSQDHDFQRCWALENLQLLTAFDNQSKGVKLLTPFQPTLL